MIINPSKLLPLRLIDNNNINNSFDGDYALKQIKDWQSPLCYFQKWQTTDTLKLQLISDTELTDLVILNLDGSIQDTVTWVLNPLVLPDYPDFRIYEISYPIANLPLGRYVIQQDQFEAEGIDVSDLWDKTVLLTYKHSFNDYSVVFDTEIEFQFRVEGWIGDFKPKRESDVYPDQRRNLTQLNALAYRQFSLFVGYQIGVPNWVIDKVNQITQCDQLKIDNVDYQPIQDAEFEVDNNTFNNYIGGSIEIEPKFNNFIKFKTEGVLPDQTFQPVLTVKPYINKGANFNITGMFGFASVLEFISIYKMSSPPVTLKFGITPNGNEIGEITVTGFTNTLTVHYLFGTAETIYISGFNSGDDVTIYLAKYQLDAVPIPINSVTPLDDELGAGATMQWFEPNPGDLLLNWDLATGLGKDNTKWSKWCILGSNGTLSGIDSKDVYFRHVGFENIIDNYLTLNTLIGANQKLIPREALPAEGVGLFTNDVNPSGVPTISDKVARARNNGSQALNYEMVKGTSDVNVGVSGNMGSGANFSVEPKTVVSLYIFKLVD